MIPSFKFLGLFFTLIPLLVYNQESDESYYLKSEESFLIVEYSPNFPDSAKNAVNFALDVWDQYINFTFPVIVHVSWTTISGSVNAYAKPTSLISNYPSLNWSDFSLPVALAENSISKNLNKEQADIELVINSNINWHLDETEMPEGKTDLATIILHEFAHGLGFLGNISYKNADFLLENPLIYDSYIYYKDSLSVVSLFNSSVNQDSLMNILTSDTLLWLGPYSQAFLGYYPKLYAPSTFNSGSSFYHFDESIFPLGDTNALMTPIINSFEMIHAPGIAALSILADIGWTNYFVYHDPIKNQESVSDTVIASVMFNTEYIDTSEVSLLYSYDGGTNFSSVPMTFNNDSSSFTASFPHYPFEKNIAYAFQTKGIYGDTIIFPPFFPDNSYAFRVGEDTVAPHIVHDLLSYSFVDTDNLFFRADVTDEYGIDSVYLKIIIGRNNFETIIENTTHTFQQNMLGYYVDFSVADYTIEEDDQVAYNIFAVDVNGNVSSLLETGLYHVFSFEFSQQPIHSFVTDFENDSILDYFYLDKWFITKDSLFVNTALHTEHPYVSSYIDGQNVQYIAELKHPIVISESPAYMSFDEVVLVEPSESNVDFGEFGFWDYVIVEAAHDRTTENWYALGKVGYDSHVHSEWLAHFYSSLTVENNNSSTALGSQELYRSRSINLLENKYIRAHDTVFVRFRLQSDYNRHAWGWCIDNLKIQESSQTIVSDFADKQVYIYPNPVSEHLFYTDPQQTISSIYISDIFGTILWKGVGTKNAQIDVSFLESGVYFISFMNTNTDLQTLRFIVL
ncbi:MAG: T9SS type A sorting domain-containing protein [Bacteroidales bacterium]|nr:T9SS type A sorting domain-containing protein [Bacteroidales bacterium]